MANELVARTTLASEICVTNPAVAYPYGDIDMAQRLTMERAGYRVGVTTNHAVSRRLDHPMHLPRLEVRGTTSTRDLAAMVGFDLE